MKAIGYVRVSTQGQVDEGVSLAAQEAKLRAWAELNGAEPVEIYRDEAVGGSRADNRPGLQAAMAAVGRGDVLACYSLSRLSRSTRDMLDLAEELRRRGADLVSLSEKIDTTSAAGKMIFRLLAVLGEFERDLISDRTRAALSYKRAQGQKTGGDVPFGYTASAGRLIPEDQAQAIIKDIVRRRRRGQTLQAICSSLEKSGIRTGAGELKWHPTSVLRILRREAGHPKKDLKNFTLRTKRKNNR